MLDYEFENPVWEGVSKLELDDIKEHNVAGHQIADLISANQKMLTVQEYEKPLAYPIGPYGLKINRAIKSESKSIWAVSFRIAQKMEKTGLKPAFTTLALTGNPLLL